METDSIKVRRTDMVDFTIAPLGDCPVASPMRGVHFVDNHERVLFPSTVDGLNDSQRIERRGHAVSVVAEGAGQDLRRASSDRDASGNVKHGDTTRRSASCWDTMRCTPR